MVRVLLLTAAAFLFTSCADVPDSSTSSQSSYFDNSGRDDVLAGGVKMIAVETPSGVYRVWTKRVGNNPRIKVLLLHGGPGMTHEYLEAFDSYLPGVALKGKELPMTLLRAIEPFPLKRFTLRQRVEQLTPLSL